MGHAPARDRRKRQGRRHVAPRCERPRRRLCTAAHPTRRSCLADTLPHAAPAPSDIRIGPGRGNVRLLEYQAKELFAEYGVPVPQGRVCRSMEDARAAAGDLGYPFVAKIQVPVGGRGKAGGIQKCGSADELELKYPQVAGMTVKGERARAVLLERTADISRELYLSLFLNRSRRCYTVIASAEGGVEIESVKNQVIREVGLGSVRDEDARQVASDLGLSGGAADSLVSILSSLSRLTVEKEAELAEINPLAVLSDGSLLALDGKVMTDDNSNFRHPELAKYQEVSEIEERAEKSGFSLVELDGNIAVVGNGAGLVMSTLDMLADSGGRPACFLDVGGGATTESVYEALTLISTMGRAKGILVNLYGGIVKTTTVAAAFIKAYDDGVIDLPVFARLRGAESEKAREMLDGTRTRLFDTVEEAIGATVMEVGRK